MKLTYYLDTVDNLIQCLLKKGLISYVEAIDLQNKAYAFDNLSHGMAWITRKFDEINR